jgi:hypothetical protein
MPVDLAVNHVIFYKRYNAVHWMNAEGETVRVEQRVMRAGLINRLRESGCSHFEISLHQARDNQSVYQKRLKYLLSQTPYHIEMRSERTIRLIRREAHDSYRPIIVALRFDDFTWGFYRVHIPKDMLSRDIRRYLMPRLKKAYPGFLGLEIVNMKTLPERIRALAEEAIFVAEHGKFA